MRYVIALAALVIAFAAAVGVPLLLKARRDVDEALKPTRTDSPAFRSAKQWRTDRQAECRNRNRGGGR